LKGMGRPRKYNLGYILACVRFAYQLTHSQGNEKILSETRYRELARDHELPSTYTVVKRTGMGWPDLRAFVKKYISFNDEELELQCKIHNMCSECPHNPGACDEEQMDCYKLAERCSYFDIL